MLRLLMLEDTLMRVTTFKSRIRRCHFGHATTNREAISILRRYPIDIFFMDYNLSRSDSEEMAEWIVENQKAIDLKQVVIHSMDARGATKLKEILNQCYGFDTMIIPGVWDLVSINNGRLQLII